MLILMWMKIWLNWLKLLFPEEPHRSRPGYRARIDTARVRRTEILKIERECEQMRMLHPRERYLQLERMMLPKPKRTGTPYR
jgi:hypothetical protein